MYHRRLQPHRRYCYQRYLRAGSVVRRLTRRLTANRGSYSPRVPLLSPPSPQLCARQDANAISFIKVLHNTKCFVVPTSTWSSPRRTSGIHVGEVEPSVSSWSWLTRVSTSLCSVMLASLLLRIIETCIFLPKIIHYGMGPQPHAWPVFQAPGRNFAMRYSTQFPQTLPN